LVQLALGVLVVVKPRLTVKVAPGGKGIGEFQVTAEAHGGPDGELGVTVALVIVMQVWM